eukprot:jgi/Botrbrau1/21259/Bobra.39_2s0051.1
MDLKMKERRTRLLAVSLALLPFICLAKEAQNAKADVKLDIMPEDLTKFNKLLAEDGLDVENSDPTDWSKWASVLSHVFLTKENGDQHEAFHALDRVMAQTRENIAQIMSGNVLEPVLTITDDIFYDNMPEEYHHLLPADRRRGSVEAPAEAPSAHEHAPQIDPHDIEGVQFYKKGKKGHHHKDKNGLEMKKIRKLPHPQTVIALLYRFKAFINYTPCVIQSQNFGVGAQAVGINIAPSLVNIKPELVALNIAGINFNPALLTVAPSGFLTLADGVDVSPALAAILPAGLIVNPAGVFVAPIQTFVNPAGAVIGPNGIEIAPVDTFYSPRSTTVPDLVQTQAPALIAGTTYYVQNPDQLEADLKAYEEGRLGF